MTKRSAFADRLRNAIKAGWRRPAPKAAWVAVGAAASFTAAWSGIQAAGLYRSGVIIASVASFTVGEIIFAAEGAWLLAGLATFVAWRSRRVSFAQARQDGRAQAFAQTVILPALVLLGAGLPCFLFWLAGVPGYIALTLVIWGLGVFHRQVIVSGFQLLGVLFRSTTVKVAAAIVFGLVGMSFLDPQTQEALAFPIALFLILMFWLRASGWTRS